MLFLEATVKALLVLSVSPRRSLMWRCSPLGPHMTILRSLLLSQSLPVTPFSPKAKINLPQKQIVGLGWKVTGWERTKVAAANGLYCHPSRACGLLSADPDDAFLTSRDSDGAANQLPCSVPPTMKQAWASAQRAPQ